MITEKTILKENIVKVVNRIDTFVNNNYDKFYIVPGTSECKIVCDYLFTSFDNLKNLLFVDISKNGLFNIVKDDYVEGDEISKILAYIKMARDYIYIHYNQQLAKEAQNIILKIEELGKWILDDKDLKIIREIKDSLNFTNYIESHKEYKQIEYLFVLSKLINKNILWESLDSVKMIGAISVLEEFEKNFKKLMSTIEDKYLKSAILEDFKNYITLNSFRL